MSSFNGDDLQILLRLLAALAAGAVIGYERSFRGRPAGFRTHALVCMTSCLLMVVPVYWQQWSLGGDGVQMDPTRMAQGIMTGIGFLGAGVIVKEGLTVRGLTTAASIWITAAIGVLAGVGFYLPLLLSVIATLGVLSLFHWVEGWMPTQSYYRFDVRFSPDGPLDEAGLRTLLAHHGFGIGTFSYRMDGESRVRRYSMVMRTLDEAAVAQLANALEANQAVLEFRIAPTGD